MCMDTSFNPCLCKDLYGYLMGLCLCLFFSYLLDRGSSYLDLFSI